MATACGDFFATTLLDTLRASETVVRSDSLAQKTIHMPAWVTEAVLPLQSREKIHFDGWKHIVTHVLDTARKHLAAAYVDHFQKETCKARRRTRLPLLSCHLGEDERAHEDGADAMLIMSCRKREEMRPTKRSLKMSNLHGHSLTRAHRLIALRLVWNPTADGSANGQALSLECVQPVNKTATIHSSSSPK